jgi:hypothetical protein
MHPIIFESRPLQTHEEYDFDTTTVGLVSAVTCVVYEIIAITISRPIVNSV